MYVGNDDALLPYKLRPNYEGYYAGGGVRVDAEGNRVVSPDHSLLKPRPDEQDKDTILLLGDSCVFGQGVNDEETIGSQLQNLIWSRHQDVKVKNIGVPGYTSWNEYKAFEEYLGKHQVSDVILIYVPNDVTFDNNQFRDARFTTVANTRLHRFAQVTYTYLWTSFLLVESYKKLAQRLNGPGNAALISGNYQNNPALDYSMEALSKIKELCDQRGIKFSVGIYRDVWHYSDPQGSLAYEAAVRKHLDERSIRCFEIKSHIDHLKMNEARVYLTDPHPSVKAIHFIAEDIDREIQQLNDRAGL